MKLCIHLSLVAILAQLYLDHAAASPRVALVIGNSGYKSSPLANPTNDAEDMAKALNRCGFTVTKKINVDRREMRDA